MIELRQWSCRHADGKIVLATCLGFLWTVLVNGAAPWVEMPTLGQAASMLGYAQDFAHMHWYTIHAYSFGYPTPVSLATGLPMAVVAGWLLRLGLPASDAYTATVALILLVGFAGAYRFALRLGARAYLPAFAATAWMGLPMVWAHQSYSSLAMGMALLPLYVSSAYALAGSSTSTRGRLFQMVEFTALCVVAIFMDGYTFMMFAVATCVVFSLRVIQYGNRREWMSLVGLTLPVYVVGFMIAWLLYTRYVGRAGFETAPLGVFRGWATDLEFIARPTQGTFWLWDAIGAGQVRSEALRYGDASVWVTTFALPSLLVAAYGLFSLPRTSGRPWIWVAVALVGLYLALGPVLKIGVVKADGMLDQAMPASAGLMATGSEWLSTHLPGFRSMRASYRWEALFLLGLWGLIASCIGQSPDRRIVWWASAYLGIILLNAPHLGDQWNDFRSYRHGMESIDDQLEHALSLRIRPGERTLLLPLNNDVMANYLAPRLRIRAYNVGGDKQIEIARPEWPLTLRGFGMGVFDSGDLPGVRRALLDGDVDVVVIAYFDSLWSAHLWPCVSEARGYSAATRALFAGNLRFACPSQTRAAYAPLVQAMREDELLSVEDEPLFSVVRLKPAYTSVAGRRQAKALTLRNVAFPMSVAVDSHADQVLGDGWYVREPVNRWSGAHANLMLPVTATCRSAGCVLDLEMIAFAATDRRPVEVKVTIAGGETVSTPFHDDAKATISLNIPPHEEVIDVSIDVPEAASPSALGMSADGRVLGASLLRIDMRPAMPHPVTRDR